MVTSSRNASGRDTAAPAKVAGHRRLRARVTSGTDKVLRGWLALVQAHGLTVHLASGVILVTLANLLLVGLVGARPGLAEGIVLEVLIVLAAAAVPASLKAATLRRQFRAISSILSEGPAGATPILLRFISEELRELHERIEDVRSVGKDIIDTDVSNWVRERCFSVTTGRYIGLDECVPSRFLELYSDYLHAQQDYLDRPGSRRSIRVNVADGEALSQDKAANPAAWKWYVEWHENHKVSLRHCERQTAIRLSRQKNLDSVIDVAFWEGEMAVLVTYEQDQRLTRLRVYFEGESYYERAERFIDAVIDSSVRFGS
jgi:hypothetical protein